jgi:hypothetical protein
MHDTNSIVAAIVGCISILASIAYVVRLLTRMESKLDVVKEHGATLKEHGDKLHAHDIAIAKIRSRVGGASSAGGPSGRHLALAPITDDDE